MVMSQIVFYFIFYFNLIVELEAKLKPNLDASHAAKVSNTQLMP